VRTAVRFALGVSLLVSVRGVRHDVVRSRPLVFGLLLVDFYAVTLLLGKRDDEGPFVGSRCRNSAPSRENFLGFFRR